MIFNRITCKWIFIIAAFAVVICFSYLMLATSSGLIQFASQQMPNKCYWNVSENSFSPGGLPQDSSLKTIQDCQRSCMNTLKPPCLSFDYNPSNSDGKYCWFAQPNQQIQYGKATGIFHFKWVCHKEKMHKTSNCNWKESSNSHTPNGIVQSHVTSLHQCKRECMTTSNCLGVDWNPSSAGSQCWFSTTSTINYNAAPGIEHYHLVCSEEKILEIDTPEKITEMHTECSWKSHPNSHSPSGVQQLSYTDPNSCQMACLLTSGCYSIDWNRDNKECWFSTSTVVNSFQGVDHYQFVCACDAILVSKYTILFMLLLVFLSAN